MEPTIPEAMLGKLSALLRLRYIGLGLLQMYFMEDGLASHWPWGWLCAGRQVGRWSSAEIGGGFVSVQCRADHAWKRTSLESVCKE